MKMRTWTWRHAILKSALPPTTRHVLLTIGCFMNDVGGGCYPTLDDLAEATGLSRRAVVEHVGKAAELGWLKVSKHGFRGQRWQNNEYAAAWPEDGEPSAPAKAKTRKSRATATTPPVDNPVENAGEGSAADALPLELATDRREVVQLTAEGGAANSAKVVQEVPTILPVSFQNPSNPGALAREEGGRDFSKFWDDWPSEHRPDNRAHARGLFDRLSPADQDAVFATVSTYRSICAKRREKPKMVLFLKGGFAVLDGAPPIDKDGYFVIRPSRPEWALWVVEARTSHGPKAVDSIQRHGVMMRAERWPPGCEPGRGLSAEAAE